jgi:hypothetical protein
MKEYIGENLCHDCFLQGRRTNDGANNRDDGDNGDNGDDGDNGKDGDDGDNEDDGDGDSHEGRTPTALGWFLLLNPTWATLDN